MKIARDMPEFYERTPLQFAADRECPVPDLGLTLRSAWQRSRESLTRIKDIFASTPLPAAVKTIYVCGSIGRMEQLPDSDCDLVIVTDDSVSPNSEQAGQIYADIWKQIEPLGMARPKPDGIFSETVAWGQLTDRSTRGLVDEDQFVYGKRIQMLLDSQPVAHAEQFRKLQFEVIKRFHRPLVSNPDIGDWTPLISEVIRYWKALEVRTTWLDGNDPGEWRYLNVKLRHSRQLIISGLLLSLCLTTEAFSQFAEGELNRNEAVRTAGEIGFLQAHLTKTPFERICTHAPQVSQAATLQTCYDLFLERMSDEGFVKRLRDPSTKELSTPEYLELHENEIQFSIALHHVLRQQVEQCPSHVRQALMLP